MHPPAPADKEPTPVHHCMDLRLLRCNGVGTASGATAAAVRHYGTERNCVSRLTWTQHQQRTQSIEVQPGQAASGIVGLLHKHNFARMRATGIACQQVASEVAQHNHPTVVPSGLAMSAHVHDSFSRRGGNGGSAHQRRQLRTPTGART
jgi:hypothetical protein